MQKIKLDSYEFLPLEKTLTLHNVIILIKSVFNDSQNNCYYNIFIKRFFVSIRQKINDKQYYPQAFLDKFLYKL